MHRRSRLLAAALGALILVGAVGGLLVTGVLKPNLTGSTGTTPGGSSTTPAPGEPTSQPTPVPKPGHEVYGYVPYWEMDASIAGHVAGTDLTTLALFSVTNKRNGTLDTAQRGYQRITGAIGQQLIADAHARGTRVELVFSSFGLDKNKRLFGGPVTTQDRLIAGLVELLGQTKADGVNVDVEQLDPGLVTAYGDFVARLRAATTAADPKAQVSVATSANLGGAAMAVASTAAGVDRIFLMGYDYHWSGSAPGASSPIVRRDGDPKSLTWSLDLYESLGVPVQRTLLGLPFYGMAWPVDGPEVAAPHTGKGTAWIPSDHLDLLRDPAVVPVLDEIEQVDVYTLPTDKTGGIAVGVAKPAGWLAIYVDSAATLTPKLAMADARGLAGAGFWAIGYERGVPEFTALIERFRAGKLK
ncbi:MAG: glycosyl hydrolase family 18 protein [Chloroflexota bacterium]|nr:glycosyl hydrolase family 18 protein [Chloroflexota bacterium]